MKKYIEVKDKKLAYIDEGKGDTIVFIHGNPTSSYLWRNIAPNFIKSHRVIVPDLIGMGDSEKLGGVDNSDYSFDGHYSFLDAFLTKLDLGEKINLVIHDWGCGLCNPREIISIYTAVAQHIFSLNTKLPFAVFFDVEQ